MAVNYDALRKMATEQLHELNKAIVQVCRERQVERQRFEMSKFRVGDTAQFVNSRTGKLVKIRIDRFNTKSVGGTELNAEGHPTFRTWRVAPSLLMSV